MKLAQPVSRPDYFDPFNLGPPAAPDPQATPHGAALVLVARRRIALDALALRLVDQTGASADVIAARLNGNIDPDFDGKFAPWIYRAGAPEWRLTRRQLPDRMSLFWFRNSPGSCTQRYWEGNAPSFRPVGVSAAVSVMVFPGEVYCAPRVAANDWSHRLIYWSAITKVAGLETGAERPDLLATAIRTKFLERRVEC